MPSSPEVIQVKFSEDLAQYADIRPVRRQTMTLRELVGLVLTFTGKQPERIRDILRQGTCPYNIYRYWWEGFELDPAQLEKTLAEFPDPDPRRRFAPEYCLWAKLSSGEQPVPHSIIIERGEARQRRWFRRQSFWDALLAFALSHEPTYQDYSYLDRADLYGVTLREHDRALLQSESQRVARRSLQQRLQRGLGGGAEANWVRMELGCRREP
jgi:hypothetical protein